MIFVAFCLCVCACPGSSDHDRECKLILMMLIHSSSVVQGIVFQFFYGAIMIPGPVWIMAQCADYEQYHYFSGVTNF